LFPYFCRGACAGLLCFDLTNRDSFIELDNWIKLIRENAGEIPIILIGTKSDLAPINMDEEEIRDYLIKERLHDFVASSIYDENNTKKEVFKSIIKSIDPNYPLHNFSLFTEKDINSEELKEFVQFFSICPICKKENHFDCLKSIYISNETEMILLREQIYKAVNASRDLKINKRGSLKIGIPCCSCYKKLFNNK